MGIVNRTPDSFFDGGRSVADAAARAHVERLVSEGADLVDVGAESTRPRAKAVPADEQLARLGDIIPFIVSCGVRASVDTTSPRVAAEALAQGATVVNTVSLESAGPLGALAADHGAHLVLTHCRGRMTDMEGFSRYGDDAYGDVVADVRREWSRAAEQALQAGLPGDRLILDPGLGFTKNADQSLELCRRLGELCALGYPVLVGPSRKSYIGRVTARERGQDAVPGADHRLGGTLAAVLDCAARGAQYVRVHDVAEVAQALAYQAAVSRPLAPTIRAGDAAGGPRA